MVSCMYSNTYPYEYIHKYIQSSMHTLTHTHTHTHTQLHTQSTHTSLHICHVQVFLKEIGTCSYVKNTLLPYAQHIVMIQTFFTSLSISRALKQR